MEEHKKTGLFQEYFDKDLYTSTFGIDYYDLYLKGKLKINQITLLKLHCNFIADL